MADIGQVKYISKFLDVYRHGCILFDNIKTYVKVADYVKIDYIPVVQTESLKAKLFILIPLIKKR